MKVVLEVFQTVWARITIASGIGAILGVLTSVTVNCTLVEITINTFFGMYFGMLFIVISGIIFWRVIKGHHPKPFLLHLFSAMVLFTGLLCFVLNKAWFIAMSPTTKIPLYSLLGISICFALLFSLVDLLNYFTGICFRTRIKPFVENEKQVYLVVATAVLLGFMFGFIFGLLDVEDHLSPSMLKKSLLREENICYPFGAVIGGISSGLNQWLRESTPEYSFELLKNDTLGDDEFFSGL